MKIQLGKRSLSKTRYSQFALIIFTLLFCLPSLSYASKLICPETDERHVQLITAEVSGSHEYRETVNTNWIFTLKKANHGWQIRLLDKSGLDLTQITPPYQFGPNHRDIFGWHFRNADNTAENDGSVNAPQKLRLFIFSKSLEGTGGFKPSTNKPRYTGSDKTDGRGWLNIIDYGLADLQKNQQARLVYMKFNACLTWPKDKKTRREEANYNNLEYLPTEQEIMKACGLGSAYQLKAFFKPRWLEGDIDGDDAIDSFAQVQRKRDGKNGLAICRAGTWLDILGMDKSVGAKLTTRYFEQMEAWSILPSNDVPKISPGQILAVERIEKSRYFVFWNGQGFDSHEDYVYVEP